MTDDDLVDRLRRATLDVPSSTLDLDAVLRSARRKRARHHAVVAVGCAAAVAGAGATLPTLPGLLPPAPPDGVAATQVADPCTGRPLLIPQESTGADPVVVYAESIRVAGDGSPLLRSVVLDTGGADVEAPSAPATVRDEILRVAREGAVDDVTTSGTTGRPGAWSSSRDLTSLDPGSYVVYDEGAVHRTEGLAQCGSTLWPYSVTSWSGADRHLLDCEDTTSDSLQWAVKELGCTPGDDADVTWDADRLRRYLTGAG